MTPIKSLIVCLLLGGTALAGETATATPWSGSVSAGYDSLYMFRGVNQLPGYEGYGSGLGWTEAALTWSPTETDSLSATTWMAFGLNETNYKELDVTLDYTRTWRDLSLTAGYALYAVLSEPGGLYSNELHVSAAYDFQVGNATVTPMIDYVYTLGPAPDEGGYINPGAGYLELRVDGDIPVYGEVIAAQPWAAAGFNIGYNSMEIGEDVQPFDGADHFETGLTLAFMLNDMITVSPYAAYSHAWVPLPGTRRNTFWGGVSVTFSF